MPKKPEENNIMEFPKSQRDQLEAPMSADCWHERVAYGTTKLKYINTFDLYNTANKIFKYGGWQRKYTDYELVKEESVDRYLIKCSTHYKREMKPKIYGQGEVIECPEYGCNEFYPKASLAGKFKDKEIMRIEHLVSYISMVELRIWNGQEWIIMTGVGGGESQDQSLAKAHENALKEAETDATKRAFFPLGYPLGLALYEKSQTHVEGATGAKPKPATKPPAKLTTTGEVVEAHGWQRLKEHLINNCEAHDALTGSEHGTALILFLKPYTFGADALMNMPQINPKTKKDRYDWVQGGNDKVLVALDMLGGNPNEEELAELAHEEASGEPTEITEEHPITDDDIGF